MTLTLPLTLSDRVMQASRVCTITRKDGTVIRIAEAQNSLTVGSETWEPVAGCVISAIKHQTGGEPSSVQVDVAMAADGVFDTYDVANAKFDSADVRIYMLNREDLSSKGLMFRGIIGPTTFGSDDRATFDVRGIASKGTVQFAQTWGPMCRTDLGSTLCKIVLRPAERQDGEDIAVGDARRFRFVVGSGTPDEFADCYLEATVGGTTGSSPSISSTPGDTSTDGSVTWVTRNAFTRAARIAEIDNQFQFKLDRDVDIRAVDGWFKQGQFRMYDGYSAGQAFEIGFWTESTRSATTFLPFGAANAKTLFAVGDWLEIWPGCNKTVAMCAARFANSLNFRGEPYFMGIDGDVLIADDIGDDGGGDDGGGDFGGDGGDDGGIWPPGGGGGGGGGGGDDTYTASAVQFAAGDA